MKLVMFFLGYRKKLLDCFVFSVKCTFDNIAFVFSWQDVINCIGGVQVLFPILELVTLQANDDYEPEDATDAEGPVDPGTPDSLEDWEVLPRTGRQLSLLL